MQSFWLITTCFVLLASGVLIYWLRNLSYGLLAGIVTLFISSVGGLYVFWGDSQGLKQLYHIEAQREVAQAFIAEHGDDPAIIIDKLQNRLIDNAEDSEGWYLLGRLYMQQSDFPAANAAFATAYELAPEEPRILFSYGESWYWLYDGNLGKEGEALFNKLLQIAPEDPDALSFLAIVAYRQENFDEATEYWQRLLALTPPTELRHTLLEAIAKAEQHKIAEQSAN